MDKKGYQYALTLTGIANPQGEPLNNQPINIQFQNHDNLFNIIEAIKSKQIFQNENEGIEFAIGLKLFSEVMLHNRKHTLFEEFAQAFGNFMKKLKSQ